jgi:hypothetical protein
VARSVGFLVFVVAVASACGTVPAPSTVDLPGPTSQPTSCAGIGGGLAILRGNPNDPRLTWETTLDGSGRTNVVWPPGYSARFAPSLEVIDSTGRVIARDGDRVPAGGCVLGDPEDPIRPVLVLPQDWPK